MPGDSFDKAWVLGGVTQGFAQPLDRVIQSLIEINERVSRPDSPSELLPRDDLARMLQQHLQKMEGLLLELYLDAACAVSRHAESSSNTPKRTAPRDG